MNFKIINMKIKIIIFILFFVLFYPELYSGPRKDLPVSPNATSFVPVQSPLQANNIQSFIWNSGVFNQDLRTNNTPGFYWPNGQTHAALFTTGLSLCGNYNGQLRAAMASYKGEYRPGYVDNSGNFQTDARFRIYSISPLHPNGYIDPNTHQVFDAWSDYAIMIPFGAPYVDLDSNGVYTPGIDIPGIKDAAQTIFVCITDADQSTHSSSEGFGGGSQPLYAQVGLTAWCYTSPGLEDLQFVKWIVVNRSPVTWTDFYLSIVVDPDLGDAGDDYIGCDTTLESSNGHLKPKNMGYVYNSDDQDGDGTGRTYGLHPPAAGMDYFLSPITPTGNNNDTVFIYNPPGSKNLMTKVGYREVGLSSFDFFNNSAGPLCERDPSSIAQGYNFMKGLKNDGSPWLNPFTHTQTFYCYPGDPESGIGWTEFTGSVTNCGGPTGTTITVNPPGDRRYIFNSGAFQMAPNDTQYIVLGQFIARGADNKNSVTKLKAEDGTAQRIFDHNFSVIPTPPPPVVNASYSSSSASLGTVDITLSWGDISEYFDFHDEIFGGDFKFQGYEVYEVRKDVSSFPNFNNLYESRDGLNLIAIYDKEDSVGIILDSLLNGQTINGLPAYSYVPVEPPFGFNNPQGFPNYGLQRHLTLHQTNYASVNNGNDKFVYGNSYKFVVVAYAYNPVGLPGGKIDRNSLSAQVITVTPEAPLLGTQFYYKNGDTLNTNRRDLGLMPIVVAQEKLQDAKYRIQFNTPDTTYNIYKSVDNGGSFTTLKSNLKFVNYKTLADDSSRIYDGILFKYEKLRFKEISPGEDTGNAGVIRDPTQPRDIVQTRYYGWDYSPPQNNYLQGSKYFYNSTKLYQSVSMSLSYPNRHTYTGFKSALTLNDLRRVKIQFTGYGSGQQAYRFLANTVTNYAFQDMREVPFKVYEIDEDDGTPVRQLNCFFLEFPDGSPDNKWQPTADSTGGKEVLYIMNSNYDPNPDPNYTSRNLLIQQQLYDIMYVWAPKLKTAGGTFQVNDQFTIYPYNTTRPEIAPGFPLYYDVDTKRPVVSTQTATQNGGLTNIRVVPNPYYGFNTLESSTSGRFVTFRNLPIQCTIKLYTLNGDLIRNLSKNDNNSTIQWNLSNQDNTPIASGIYLALVDAPGIGTTVIKLAIFTPEERVDF